CTAFPTPPADRYHTGRFSLVVGGEKPENVSGRFTLAVHAPDRTLDLATPIGTTLARIELTPAGARLIAQTQDGPTELRGPDAEALTYEVFGWTLPMDGLADWILGRPAPDRPANTWREDGKIVAFEQDGWSFEVLERFPNDMPRRLLARRPARLDAPPLTLRLVLDEVK
ncbi:MAG TPA: outer membrane lipoprotein LolB, partial [Burkholderiaceae bacterium]|nr:outer membrane lipoprotein LolB [Burkholderiaceae bacterium]